MIAESGLTVDVTASVLREVGLHELVNIDCPGCASVESVFETNKNGFRVVRSLDCSSVYVSPRQIECVLVETNRRFPQLSNSREGQQVNDAADGRRDAQY